MATIRKRGQSWEVQVGKTGSSPTSRSFKRKADAQSWARQMEIDIERAPFGLDRGKLRSLTLGDLLTRHRDHTTPRKRGAEIERYRIARLLGHKIAHLALERLLAPWKSARNAWIAPPWRGWQSNPACGGASY